MMNATPGFPCSEYHCSILPSRYRSTVSRTSSGRTAKTWDCSKPGLMVPMARILVVGAVFIAAPLCVCEIEADKASDKCHCGGGKSEFHIISLLCGAKATG